MSAVFAEVKRLIIRSGMSEQWIGHRAKLAPQTIHYWLVGKAREPDLKSLIAVAKLFGKSVDLTDAEARLVDTRASVAAKASRAREFVGLWRRYQ